MSVENNYWVPSIGDPTIIAWLTVVTYFVVALICLKAALISKNDKSTKTFWNFITIFLIFLGINKQLDLQTLLTTTGRYLAHTHGWYQDRRFVQIAFIIFLGSISITGLIYLFRKYKNTTIEIKFVLFGCIILFAFILIRASSFHHMDIFIQIKVMGMKMNWILELGGLTVIGVSAHKYLYKNKVLP